MKDFNFPLNTFIFDMSSEDYHGLHGTWSSSQLKKMVEDPENFYKTYITKELGRESNSAFDVGTYFHTALLEPDKLSQECVVFTGNIKRGKEWEDFKTTHKGKVILSVSDKAKADILINAVKQSPLCMRYVTSSKAEVTCFVKVYVMGKDVFTFVNDDCYALSIASGWVKSSLDYEPEDIKDFGVPLILKVRSDSLWEEEGVISDLKSTTGNVKDRYEVQGKVEGLRYQLSASLYLDLFTIGAYQKGGRELNKFVWLFASKDMGIAKAWSASEKNIQVGRGMWKKAVTDLAKYQTNNWKFEDEEGEIGPADYSTFWLNEE